MKNQLFAIAAAALVVAGCSKTEVVKVAENRAIGFSSFVGNPTKAPINSVNDLQSFNVFGGYTTDLKNNFNDVVVSKGKEGWTYTDTQYWEANKTYTFQAYAGAEATAVPTANGVQFTRFQATGDADLLASDVVKVTTDASSLPNGSDAYKVPFNFRHVLSMIKFTFKSALAENVSITISNLTVKQVNSTGDYTSAVGNTGSWGNLSVRKDYTFFTPDAFAAPATKVSSEAIVMPQTAAEKTIEVTFTLNATGGLTITDAEHTVKLPEVDWKEGMRYNYVAELTKDNIDPKNPLKPIEFSDPTVDPWKDQEGGNVDFSK